jgi:hypothetical protein
MNQSPGYTSLKITCAKKLGAPVTSACILVILPAILFLCSAVRRPFVLVQK